MERGANHNLAMLCNSCSSGGGEVSEDNKLHYYAFSFIHAQGNTTQHGSVYLGYEGKMITVPRIKEAKASALMPSDSVLLAVSYLGYMTHEECVGEA